MKPWDEYKYLGDPEVLLLSVISVLDVILVHIQYYLYFSLLTFNILGHDWSWK